jgi:hypothetical protein
VVIFEVYFVQGPEFLGRIIDISGTGSENFWDQEQCPIVLTANGKSRITLFRTFKYRKEVHSANLEGKVDIEL